MNHEKGIALVFAQDGIKSLAFIPILDFFKSYHHPFHLTVASGAGALVAALYLMGRSRENIISIVSRVLDRKTIINLTYNSLLKKSFTGLFGGSIEISAFCNNQEVLQIYEEVFGHALLEDIQPPLYVQCTDVKTGVGVVIKKGLLREILYASTNLYPLLAPQKIDTLLLGDGVYSDYLPISAALNEDIEKIYGFYGTQSSCGQSESYLEYWMNIFHRSYALKQIELILQILEKKGKTVELFNISTPKEISLIDPQFVNEILQAGENLSTQLKLKLY